MIMTKQTILWDGKRISIEEFREKYKNNPTLTARLERAERIFAERFGKMETRK